MGKIRVGESITPTTISPGIDGNLTSPRVVEFDLYARPVIVHNNTGNGNKILVKLNATDDTDFGGGSDDGIGYFPVNDEAAVEVSLGGILSVKRVSFVTTDGGDDLDNVEVHGWNN